MTVVKRFYADFVLPDIPNTGAEFCVVAVDDYDELDGRFNAVFKQKEFAEHNWGIANQRIAKLEEALREISKDNFLYNSTQIAIKALRDSSAETKVQPSMEGHFVPGPWAPQSDCFCEACKQYFHGESSFKNFHRLLCERFGYTHDPIDWRRDQLSLIEHIASQAKTSAEHGK
jgi:hypothetical protein